MSKILKGNKIFHHYRAILEIPIYVSIMPQGVRFYKNIIINLVFKKCGYKIYKINREKLRENLSNGILTPQNDDFLINFMTYYEHEGVRLENFPTFVVINRELAEHRRMIIDSL